MKKMKAVPFVAASIFVLGSLAGCQSKTSESVETTVAKEIESDVQTAEIINESDYVFGTVSLPYADFYYGELTNLSPEDTKTAATGQYDVKNVVQAEGYEATGMYDAVASATTQKSKAFEITYTEDTETGVNILGPVQVNVAISKALYEDVQKAAEAGTTCENPLMDLVASMENVSETVPAEYKVIQSNGTLSKTIGNTVVDNSAAAQMSTNSAWGNYEITITGPEIDVALVQGVVIETEDGKLYGMEHLDNIWRQPLELAFAVEEFQEPHGNTPAYQRFEDIQGKNITKITYMIANGDDIEIDTSLYCKELLGDAYSITGDETVSYSKEGTEVAVTMNVPEGVTYEISDVIKSRKSIDAGLYKQQDGKVVLDGSAKPGIYELAFSSEKYADLEISCLVESGLTTSDLSFEDQQLRVAENDQGLTISDYLAGITAVSLNGKALSGQNLGTVIFNEDGTVNLDAVIKGKTEETKVFDGADTYELAIEASGYPSITITVVP